MASQFDTGGFDDDDPPPANVPGGIWAAQPQQQAQPKPFGQFSSVYAAPQPSVTRQMPAGPTSSGVDATRFSAIPPPLEVKNSHLLALDGPPVWQSDSNVNDCNMCNKTFDFWNRRHHVGIT